MIFKDRKEAGVLLAEKLLKYKNMPNTLVIGLPRGGVVTAYEVSKALNLPLDIICARKVGAPQNPELAIGAVTETGEGYFNEDLILRLRVSQDYLQKTVERESQEALRRVKAYRGNLATLDLEDKTVILVDDGMATGATMKAAVKSVKTLGAAKTVAALPVTAQDSLEEIREEVYEAIALQSPTFFMAVGEFYEDFSQTSDQQVIELLTQAHLNYKTGGK